MTSKLRSLNVKTWLRSLVAVSLIAILPQLALAFPVEVSSAPESDLALTLKAIKSAQRSIHLNIYELTSADIANALIQKIRSGVLVQILEEGQPVGGLSAAAKGIQQELSQAMRTYGHPSDRFYEMRSQPGIKRRFRYDHGKYAVIDGQSLLIGSENYSPTGHPAPGTLGNRGWEVLLHEPKTAAQFQALFLSDSNPANPDIVDLTAKVNPSRRNAYDQNAAVPLSAGYSGASRGKVLQANDVVAIAAPQNSVQGVLYLINNSRVSIDLQQMSFALNWGNSISPVLSAIVQAAKRGVRIRVLLNDDHVFDRPGHPSVSKNLQTVNYLKQIASAQNLPISAAIADIKAMGVTYIHNKGAIFDGHITLVSSINWGQNSFQNNRETAVAIDSQPIADFYRKLFERDWRITMSSQPRSIGR